MLTPETEEEAIFFLVSVYVEGLNLKESQSKFEVLLPFIYLFIFFWA